MLNPADTAFLTALETRLPTGTLKPAEPRYLEEPRGRWHGQAGAVALPRDVEEVAAVVRACGEARVGLVPYGGGTGLVGGQVMGEGALPLILSLERMNRLRAVYAQEGVMLVEAGMTLADARAAAEAEGRLFPLSLGSEGTCRIGGNLSTNAGGVNVLRYGNARELCLGLEAVLPDGSVWHGLKRLRKDNTGYDLRGLLIGAEGTLGVITAAALRLFPRPAQEGAAVLAVESPAAALRLLAIAQEVAGEGVSAFELISRQGLDFMTETGFDVSAAARPAARLDGADRPWPGPRGRDPRRCWSTFSSAGSRRGLSATARSPSPRASVPRFWSIRETIPLANRRVGAIASHDISLPLSAIPAFLARPARR